MSSSTIFLLLIIGVPLAMVFMHRGGHSHGSGNGGTGGGMGGCGGGHNHGGGHDHDTKRGDEPATQAKSPLLGPPGTASGNPAPVAVEGHRHRVG